MCISVFVKRIKLSPNYELQKYDISSHISRRLSYHHPAGFKRSAKLLIIGLDNAGKSTLLDRMASGRMVQNPPTFQGRSQQLDMGNVRFTAYDLGGHPQVRRVWRDYFPAVDGIVFIVDCADTARFDEAHAEVDSLLKCEETNDIPVAILFNKTDLTEAVGEEYLSNKLGLDSFRTGKKHEVKSSLSGRPMETFPCSILRQQGYGEALRWLAYYID